MNMIPSSKDTGAIVSHFASVSFVLLTFNVIDAFAFNSKPVLLDEFKKMFFHIS